MSVAVDILPALKDGARAPRKGSRFHTVPGVGMPHSGSDQGHCRYG
jgi:hypothetical protein